MPIYYSPPRPTKDEIKALAKAVHDEMYSIENTLKRRGYVYAGEGHTKNVILPGRQADIERFFQYMSSRTFRNILKKIVVKKHDIRQEDFETECSQDKLHKYLGFLESSGVLNKEPSSSFSLALDVDEFGYTLEWYVAELFKRELGCTAAWGVRVKDISVGGDFDVLARIEAQLACVETKATSPESVTKPEIRHFLQRDREFDPDISVFLVDTKNNLSGLITAFEEVITSAMDESISIRDPNYRRKIQQLNNFRGIYHPFPRMFIINSKPSILTNLRRCLKYYFDTVIHSTYPSRDKQMNFIARH
jgi:hypothetical protein